jgi:hypothetical protein
MTFHDRYQKMSHLQKRSFIKTMVRNMSEAREKNLQTKMSQPVVSTAVPIALKDHMSFTASPAKKIQGSAVMLQMLNSRPQGNQIKKPTDLRNDLTNEP